MTSPVTLTARAAARRAAYARKRRRAARFAHAHARNAKTFTKYALG